MKKIKILASLALVISLLFNVTTISFASNEKNYQLILQSQYSEPQDDSIIAKEIILYDGEIYNIEHRKTSYGKVIEISGSIDYVMYFDELGNVLNEDKNYTNHNNIKASGDGWYQLSTYTNYTHIVQGASAIIIAAAIAGAITATPITPLAGAFINVAQNIVNLVAGVAFTATIYTSGRYRVEGTHTRFEMTSDVYVLGRRFVSYWNGTR